MNTPPNPETFEFTIEVAGEQYDVYWFKKDGKYGQIAFKAASLATRIARPGTEWEIVIFRAGRKSQDEVKQEIIAQLN